MCVSFGNPKLTHGAGLSAPRVAGMRTDKNPNASLPWVIVFASAAMTLSSATVKTRAPLPVRLVPVRLEATGSEPECECGDSCACPRQESPEPAPLPVRRDAGLRA